MSSMKSFKSRISQKRVPFQSRANMSNASDSIIDYNPKNLFISPKQVQFILKRNNDQIIIEPSRMFINNNTGARLFIHIVAQKQDYFNITPKKYILESGNSVEISIKLIEISYVRMEDYEASKFQVSWGIISQEQIANKIIPRLTNSTILKCQIVNKDLVNQILAKKTYQNTQTLGFNNLQKGRNNNRILSNSNILINDSRRQDNVRSGLDASDLKIYEDRPSLLRPKVIMAVAIVSFIIGFIGV